MQEFQISSDMWNTTSVTTISWTTDVSTEEPWERTTDSDYEKSLRFKKYNTLIVFPILIFFGTFGNVVSFVIFSRPQFRSSVTSLYFRFLAVFDTLALNVHLWNTWLRQLVGSDVIPAYKEWCQFHRFLTYLLPQLSSWILVLVSVERLVGVLMPHKVRSIFTKYRAVASCIVMALCLICVNSATIPFVSNRRTPETGKLVCRPINLDFWFNIWSYIDLAFFSLVPFLIITVCNVGIIYMVKNRRRQLGSAASGGPSTVAMTFLLISVSCSFLVLTVPFTAYVVAGQYWHHFNISDYHWEVWRTIGTDLIRLNNAVNFPLYCLSGRPFRQELLVMCGYRTAARLQRDYNSLSTRNSTLTMSRSTSTTSKSISEHVS